MNGAGRNAVFLVGLRDAQSFKEVSDRCFAEGYQRDDKEHLRVVGSRLTKFAIFIATASAVLMFAREGIGEVLMREDFSAGAKRWERKGEAFLSDFSRRKGTKSLLLMQWKDEDAGSYWLSPAIKNPSKLIRISFELHKKAYIAIKKEFPGIKVGLMLYGLAMNPGKDVDIFLREKLYDYCDFIDTHTYASSVDWTEWKRLQRAYRKMGKEPVPLISTEFCRVGGMDQVQRSRSMISAHLDAFGNGMLQLHYFNQCNEERLLEKPFLREPTDLGGTQTSGFMFLQRVDRPKLSEDIVPKEKRYRWTVGSWGLEYGGHSLVPLLQTMTYYNLIQNFQLASFRRRFSPDRNSVAYVFDRRDATVASIWLKKPVGTETFLVKSTVPGAVQDLFGRRNKVNPLDGLSLLSVDENPLTLLFDNKVEKLEIKPASGGAKVGGIAPGAKGEVVVEVPGVWEKNYRLRVFCNVDGTWPGTKEKTLRLRKRRSARCLLPVRVAPARETGAYPLTVKLFSGESLISLMKAELKVSESLQIELGGLPTTRKLDPAIKVVLKSLFPTATEGVIIFDDRYFSTQFTNTIHRKPYKLPPEGSVEAVFPVATELVNLTTSYEVKMIVEQSDGTLFEKTEEVSFRACERASGKIIIDGDLSDWRLGERTAIPSSLVSTMSICGRMTTLCLVSIHGAGRKAKHCMQVITANISVPARMASRESSELVM